MEEIRVSATEARRNFFSIINKVIYSGATVVVNKADANAAVEIRQFDEESKRNEKIAAAEAALIYLRRIFRTASSREIKKTNRFFRGGKETTYLKKLVRSS